MNIDEIRKNKPEGANLYRVVDGVVEYFKQEDIFKESVEVSVYKDNKWWYFCAVYKFQLQRSNLKPL